ncbi:hypothetical protein [Edaphosphingomonas haloaromaticamans]|uniref:Uncharacterized protein n=1 Tax=Edaphosphingomonas haloaromaticamans TaxID=653954 RepID=A0A1S1HHV3_9SPHN|nr:hypothetical protein [Sphingomonas haloaromaticamans]OHT21657.1 hypothetical protein BHE75_03668 [Sphingomonas haloaromaticamans]
MNGLTSSTPSQSAIRLTISGFLLMLVQSTLLLMSSSLGAEAGVLIWTLTPLAFCAFVAALIGIPEPPEGHWRQRHGR